jgi:dihydrofolate reductase
MTNYVYIATSLDGFIAASDGSLDWLEEIPNPEKGDNGFVEFMNGIDALVMGRKTFEKVLTGVNIPKELVGKAEVVNGTPKMVVDQLSELGHQHLYIDGGITIQNFLEEDMIDEMIITKISILLGGGIPLFGKLSKRLQFNHTKTEVHHDMMVTSHYTRKK